jgi:hypothetical protein
LDINYISIIFTKTQEDLQIKNGGPSLLTCSASRPVAIVIEMKAVHAADIDAARKFRAHFSAGQYAIRAGRSRR